MLKWRLFQFAKKQQQLDNLLQFCTNTEQQRYASPRTALVLAVVLIQMSEPLHNFHIQICDYGQCNVGVESPSWEQSSWYQPTSNCPCQDLSNCSLWICSNYVQLGFVKEGGVVFGPRQSQLASLEWGSRTMKDAWRLHKISNMSGCNNSHRQTVYYLLNILIYALQASN